eukprot:CAMPEP_0201592840 /NCGR_PEP_ID=MMETSP0190_2-20130828/190617_1 /ASSEMBLY_ACC=CAM_ASM_000263 /TAXON_ID=37353 /ORGANISM="Rosalina sp." /LENGTH=950 /DNA_ID=CAMNT_0048051781 /DNA_START=624 /DNA_END=3476 /DNA_ORIENTATION=-
MKKLSNNQQEQPGASPPASSSNNHNGNGRKKKAKKRNKRKNQRNQKSTQQSREEQLIKLKQDRQELLVSFGNNLMENLNAKYCNYFDDDMREMWEQTIFKFVSIYEDIDQSLIEDDEFLNEKKIEMSEEWEDIMILIKEDFDATQEERRSIAAQRAKEKKMKEYGIVGVVPGRHKQPTAAQIKARKKREEKQRLKEIARLEQMSQIAIEQDIKQQNEPKKTKRKRQRKKKKKKEVVKKPKDDWDVSDSDEEDEQKEHKNMNMKMAQSLNSNFDAFADSDDESQESAPAKEYKRVRQTVSKHNDEVKEEKKYDNDNDNDSIKSQRNKPNTKKKKLRSPICVVMGHVDAGKTKILDCIRGTNVQNKESGGHGITQQIGATNLSIDYIKQRTQRLAEHVDKLRYKIPGLLFLDTPGHAAFSNLRSRGSSLCDVAVLVVDITEGLKPQSIESLNMLKQQSCPVIVALNKIDLCNGWKPDPDPNTPFLSTYKQQAKHTKQHFENRLQKIIVQFAEQGLNAQLYTKNKRMDLNDGDISIVPTSATTGEGIPDLLYLIVHLTKKYMQQSISFKAEFEASVLEVKETTGYGATIDIIVSNGTLNKNDTIIICGMNGPIITKIRALLLPKEATEMRMKAKYTKAQEITASMGVRIAAVGDLSTAVAGAPLFVVPRNLKSAERKKVIEELSNEVQKSVKDLLSKVDKHGGGVFVQASTLGSLEALITFLTGENIPVSGVGIGTISKKIISKASTLGSKQPEYAAILAFDVKIGNDARQLAAKEGITIFESDVIYHLQKEYEQYVTKIRTERQRQFTPVFPVEMQILSNTKMHIMHKKNPLVLGVKITRGSLRMGIPICAKRYDASRIAAPLYLGRIVSIRLQDRDVENAALNDIVSIKIMGDGGQNNIEVGKSFIWTDPLISEITRESLDVLKEHFLPEIKQDSDTGPHLMHLKKYFNVI